MSIIKNYKRFLNESLDPSIKTIEDVPGEVITTAKRIANDFFDKVRKPIFELDNNKGLIFRFEISEQDFLMIDGDEDLTLDLNATARGKRANEVSLIFDDKISETYQVTYIVKFDAKSDIGLNDIDLDEDGDSDFIDEYELNGDEFNHNIDEDEIDNHIGKNINKDIEFEDDDEDEDELHEEFNPSKKEDWRKAGTSLKRGIGILSPEEAIQKGMEIVNRHKGKKQAYDYWMKEDPKVAEKFLIYVANHPQAPYPKWSVRLQKWTSNAGIDSDASGILSSRKL